ncbi:NUMOD1 domain-containing DNA-binding protein [Lactococcus lactis]|uniref:NUMOD1 domain-containing DNA-binding protein n=1 Tax=Lactococcus lactis TaxID=1358 RepID=UPI003D16647A
MKKKVIVVNMVAQKQNELITEFESAKQASRELGISYDSIKKACQDMGNCFIGGDLAFVYESSVHGLNDDDIINKIKIQRLNRLIFGK